MGQCKNHPLSTSGDGVCPSCLQKKLKSVWWGDTGSSVDAEKVTAKPSTAIFKLKPCIDPVHPKEAIAILGSIVSIQNRNHRGSKPGTSIITEAGLDFRLDSRYADSVTKVTKPVVSNTRVVTMPGLLCPPSKISHVKDRKRWLTSSNKKSVVGKTLTLADSKPLVDRIAKETALRVIREVKYDREMKYDVSVDGEREGEEEGNVKELRGISPSRWQSKWRLKGIVGSSMTAGSNKVFPSKPSAETKSVQTHSSPAKTQSRVNVLTIAGADHLPASGDRVKLAVSSTLPAQEMVIVGMPDRILKPEDMNQRLRTSYNTVLQWLQDLPVPDTLLLQKTGDPGQGGPYMMDLRNRDLAVVGQLHGIAEEQEILDEEESSEESEADGAPTAGNNLDAVSSFGKFLIRAAQRQPKQGLSRVQARPTALSAR